MSELDVLFDEFAARHARGEDPNAHEYLERAGGETSSRASSTASSPPARAAAGR
jgi:hypothetical protein